jgi:hypothetical protein
MTLPHWCATSSRKREKLAAAAATIADRATIHLPRLNVALESRPRTARNADHGQQAAETKCSQLCTKWWNFGAPEEIRTPDPQIRRLLRVFDFIEIFCKRVQFIGPLKSLG